MLTVDMFSGNSSVKTQGVNKQRLRRELFLYMKDRSLGLMFIPSPSQTSVFIPYTYTNKLWSESIIIFNALVCDYKLSLAHMLNDLFHTIC
jgi:hypothetical protein